MPPRRCLVAPQNTFIENAIRLCESQNANFLVANSRIVDHPIVFANEGFCSMTGFSRYELLQKSATLSTMHGDLTTAESKERLAAILDGEAPDVAEMLIYKKNSKPMWISLKTSPIKNERDVAVLILVIVRDISSSKHPIEVDTGTLNLGKFARFALSVTRNKMLSGGSHAPNNSNANNSLSINNNLASNVYNKTDNHQQYEMAGKSNLNSLPTVIDTTARLVAPSPAGNAALTVSNPIKREQSKSSPTPLQRHQHDKPVDPSVPLYKQEAPRTPPHIVLHYSRFKTTWDWLVLFLTVYTCVLTPYTATFHSKSAKSAVLICLDTVVDVFFVVDVFLNFHVTFVGPAGEVVSDPKVIRRTYLRKWFVFDLFACLPYDVFGAFLSTVNKVGIMSDLGLLRLLRITRVGRHVDSYIEYGASVLMLLIVMFVLIAHWFACIWYSIGVVEAKRGTPYGWLLRLAKELDIEYYLRNISSETTDDISVSDDGSGIEEPDSGSREQIWQGGPNEIMVYSTALYYTLSSMTSIGFGNVAAYTESEKIFTICMMIFGSLLYATIFGNVTTIFQQMYSSTGRYHEMLKNVKEFMELHDVPASLSERVLDYVVSTWSITKGIDASKVLGYCPADMRADICVHLNRKVFYEQSAFRLASESCLRALAVHFTISHWAPGDMLFHQGESLESLCFIASGSLEVLQDDEIVAVLSTGDSLGDMFWKEETVGQCRANVRALTYCNLHIIKREPLLEVLKFYQSFANSFARNLKLTYNLRKRLIFRKIADVIKERELAERTKDNPPMDLAMNHPVRKLISRFRKMSNLKMNVQSGLTDDSSDLEKDQGSLAHGRRLEDRKNSKDVGAGSAAREFQSRTSTLWKLSPSSEARQPSTGDSTFYQTPNSFRPPSSSVQSSLSNAASVKHVNPTFRNSSETTVQDVHNAFQSSPATKLSPGNRWGKLLSAAGGQSKDADQSASSYLKPVSNNPAARGSASVQANSSTLTCADDFDKMTFYEMNCSLRNDMAAINNRMGGIDMRLGQILQMLRETIDPGCSQAEGEPPPQAVDRIQIASSAESRPLATSTSLQDERLTKPSSASSTATTSGKEPATSSSVASIPSSSHRGKPKSAGSVMTDPSTESSFDSAIDSARNLIQSSRKFESRDKNVDSANSSKKDKKSFKD